MFELKRNLTVRLGGRARHVDEPTDLSEFVTVVRDYQDRGQAFRILGGGSNILASGASIDEPVVVTRGVRQVEQRSRRRWTVESGANLTALGHRTTRMGLSGLECCTGIPGTVGAAIRINAGGKYGSIAGVVREVTSLDREGRMHRREVSQEHFGYRNSAFFDEVVLEAELEFEESNVDRCKALVQEVLRHKRTTQPLRQPSAGCIFRNPPGDSAGRLIDAAGLKGARVGGAMVSPVHANYIVNVGEATGQDFLALIARVQERVEAHSGVSLELEVEVW